MNSRTAKSFLILIALIGAVGCASKPLPDRVTDAKSLYTSTFNGLKVVNAVHPFPPKAKKAVGNSLAAIESQIDAADESVKLGNNADAKFWLEQANAALRTANRLKDKP